MDTYCDEGVTYWVDGCGNLEDVMVHCQEGCNAAHTGCKEGCTPQCTGKCCGDDGCGGFCTDNCSATGQVCNQSSCLCEGVCSGQTCVQMGKECGLWNDGCGTQLSCGTCPAGETCSAGVCECDAQTCEEMSKECGNWDDGCGTQLSCGTCDGGLTCSAAGQCIDELPHFSFFVTSLAALRALSGSQDGFGGDLTYGETGTRAGLDGADKLCAEIAERSMPGSSIKQWRAFLCTSYEDAIDRIGEGPWYDRLGRLFANNKSELMNDRPVNADPVIINDFPNEDGVPNHQPDPTQPQVDNHDMITGCNQEGRLYSGRATCIDWTSKLGNNTIEGKPRVGHSWPRATSWPILPPGTMENWISCLDESGCAPGVNLLETGPPGTDGTIGSGGGYGGFYCFALEP